ncbi:hypothetical protein [Spirillospora sp. NPDC029432]|uniref:hypothetical protein n=1 Tax=Spirillospora sp. NPDC029432 TaxID=3154599 RepID=UPI003451B9DE
MIEPSEREGRGGPRVVEVRVQVGHPHYARAFAKFAIETELADDLQWWPAADPYLKDGKVKTGDGRYVVTLLSTEDRLERIVEGARGLHPDARAEVVAVPVLAVWRGAGLNRG